MDKFTAFDTRAILTVDNAVKMMQKQETMDYVVWSLPFFQICYEKGQTKDYADLLELSTSDEMMVYLSLEEVEHGLLSSFLRDLLDAQEQATINAMNQWIAQFDVQESHETV